MSSRIFLAVLALVLGVSSVPAAPPTREQINRWVEQLGADDFAARQQASDLLWKAGAAAEPSLKKALDSDDPEVVRRAGELLARFQWGIYPDTPPAILKLIEQYRAGDASARQSAVLELFKLGRPGFAAVRKFATLEKDPAARQNLLAQIAAQEWQLASTLIAEGERTEAERVLENGLSSGNAAALRHYAAFQVLAGTAGARVRRLRQQVKRGDKHAAEVLTHLARAAGDLVEARRAAEATGMEGLVESIVEEQGDWKTLARLLGGKTPAPNDPLFLVRRATVRRLGGDQAGFEADLRKLGTVAGSLDPEFLSFNDRPAQAIEAHLKRKAFATAFELLALQMRWREAFALPESTTPQDAQEALFLGVQKARLLYRAGEEDRARGLFTALAEHTRDLNKDNLPGMIRPAELRLLQAESSEGLEEMALDHCALLLAGLKTGPDPGSLVAAVFPQHEAAAACWWRFLRGKFTKEQPPATLRRLRALLVPGKVGPDFAALVREAEEASRKWLPAERQQWLMILAETCTAAGREDLARKQLDRAVQESGSAAALEVLGDHLAQRKHWEEAARSYGRAWDKDRRRSVPLYLHGWALTRAGHDKEGRELMETARWLPLADEESRYQLARALEKKGLSAEAEREWDFLVRTAGFRSVYAANALGHLAQDALGRKDYFRVADCDEHVCLILLQGGGTFVDNDADLLIPARIHQSRARGHLAAGHLEEARKEVERGLEFLPGDLEVPLELIRALDRQGRRAEADRLFRRLFRLYEGLCRDYPRAASCHNQAAWLAARCGREIDRALAHARRATELHPRNAGYLDTLAEVHFQRGDRDRAIQLMKQCVALAPGNPYFAGQLQRFRKGDRSAELPAER